VEVIVERSRELLARAQLSVVSAEPDHELERLAERITTSVRIGGRTELEAWFGRLLAARDGAEAIAPKTLDLLGHSTARTSLLRLGDWVIDAASPAVATWFRELAERRVLPRLGIHAVRLLGCKTAETGPGRATICALSDLLGVEVYGTNHLLHEGHYDEHGFRDIWGFLLVGARELRRTAGEHAVTRQADRGPRTLDLDALPAHPLGPQPARWPRRVVPPSAARQLLQLIRRDAGAPMPGLLATPSCELALLSAKPGAYHVVDVLFEGAFVRFYPDGVAAPGVAYPVDDAHALRRIVDGLAPSDVTR
jgi:hypothetical protein